MAKSGGNQGLEFENEVRGALRRVGLRDVAGGHDVRVGGHQIDACGGWDDVLVVAECTQSNDPSASVHDLILQLRGKQADIRQGFRKLDAYSSYTRFEFAVITRNIRYTDGDVTLAAQRPKVHLMDFQTLGYYQRLSNMVGQRAAVFNLLGELRVNPKEFDLPRVPAFRVQMDRGLPGYLFWCDPHELLKVAYVARRESGREKYYQRILSGTRLNDIKTFIQKGGIFPNSVIVSFDAKPEFRKKPAYENSWPSWLEFGELVFPHSYRSCWVIDGQHRLYAFGKLPPNAQPQKLAVFAFEALPEHRQAKYFIEINKEQKPVPPDLIWDLEGEMSPETPHGRIANCVKALNSSSPLKDKVFLPLSGERKKGQLKMSGVCQDLEDAGLLNDRTRFMTQAQKNPLAYRQDLETVPRKVAGAVAAFLEQVRANCSENLWTQVLLRPGGITVALNVYEQILARVGQVPSPQQLTKYAEALALILADLAPGRAEIRKFVREQLTSYAQRRQITAEILGEMQKLLEDPEFAKTRVAAGEPLQQRFASFERKLAECVCHNLNIAQCDDLRQKAPEKVWREVETRIKGNATLTVAMALGLGDCREIIVQRNNAAVMMPLFTDPANGFGNEQAVLAGLSGIMTARNATAHGRRVGNRRLVAAYLETFERLVGS